MTFGRLLKGSAYLTAGLLAALAGVIVGVVLLVVVVMTKGDADPAKARVEVQNYYESRFPGQVEVVDCDYVSAESEFDQFACSLKVTCRDRFRFSVPRAGAIVSRGDISALALDESAERPRCRT